MFELGDHVQFTRDAGDAYGEEYAGILYRIVGADAEDVAPDDPDGTLYTLEEVGGDTLPFTMYGFDLEFVSRGGR